MHANCAPWWVLAVSLTANLVFCIVALAMRQAGRRDPSDDEPPPYPDHPDLEDERAHRIRKEGLWLR